RAWDERRVHRLPLAARAAHWCEVEHECATTRRLAPEPRALDAKALLLGHPPAYDGPLVAHTVELEHGLLRRRPADAGADVGSEIRRHLFDPTVSLEQEVQAGHPVQQSLWPSFTADWDRRHLPDESGRTWRLRVHESSGHGLPARRRSCRRGAQPVTNQVAEPEAKLRHA